MHLHLLGICGTFMGGLALLARAAGHTVTGCDSAVYPPMSDQLREAGISLHEGYDAEQLDQVHADLYVVGNAMTRGKPVIEAILNRGLPYVSGPQWLGDEILPGKWPLVVAGTHGKTSTASMLAWILAYAGLSPGFLIGGVPRNFHVSALWTPGRYFVIEGDEYDTAFFDKRSKFVHYRPRTVILNNLEYDHADIFPDLAAIETQFHHLVRIVPGTGRVIAHGRDAAIGRVLQRGVWSGLQHFASAEGWALAEAGDPVVTWRGAQCGVLPETLRGRHNRLNALAAIAAADHAGVRAELACEALRHFQGVKRRLEVRGTVGGVTVYDDFAHHPTAIAATIEALRSAVDSGGRIIALLEPRTNTMKLGAMRQQLPASLAGADLVFCYSRGITWDAGEALSPLGPRAAVYNDLEPMLAALKHVLRPGDHVLVMSNGGFENVHVKLLARLAG